MDVPELSRVRTEFNRLRILPIVSPHPVQPNSKFLLPWWGMDALSEVLTAVKLDSAFFYNGELSAPWSFRSPNSCELAPYINQSSGHVILYHLLIAGKAYGRLS